MRGIRTLLHRHRALAGLALAFVLAVRLLMPSGFMLAPDAKVLTVVICTGVVGEHQIGAAGHSADQSRSPAMTPARATPAPIQACPWPRPAGADVPLLGRRARLHPRARRFAAIALPSRRASALSPAAFARPACRTSDQPDRIGLGLIVPFPPAETAQAIFDDR